VQNKRSRIKTEERENMLELDDSEGEDGGRNKEKLEGNKKAKERIKLEAKGANLGKKIEEMVKSKVVHMDKALQTKVLLTDKKNAINQARWEVIWADDKRKAALEERRLELEEKKAMMELITDENRTMTMDPSTMDAFHKRVLGYEEGGDHAGEEASAWRCSDGWLRWRCSGGWLRR
jgi:hypothetical protein